MSQDAATLELDVQRDCPICGTGMEQIPRDDRVKCPTCNLILSNCGSCGD